MKMKTNELFAEATKLRLNNDIRGYVELMHAPIISKVKKMLIVNNYDAFKILDEDTKQDIYISLLEQCLDFKCTFKVTRTNEEGLPYPVVYSVDSIKQVNVLDDAILFFKLASRCKYQITKKLTKESKLQSYMSIDATLSMDNLDSTFSDKEQDLKDTLENIRALREIDGTFEISLLQSVLTPSQYSQVISVLNGDTDELHRQTRQRIQANLKKNDVSRSDFENLLPAMEYINSLNGIQKTLSRNIV
jgi:hypothetical protein